MNEETNVNVETNEVAQNVNEQNAKEQESTKNIEITDEMKSYIAKIVQSETDRVRTEYSKKLTEKDDTYNKKIQKIEAELKQSMGEKELAEYENKQKAEEFERKQAEFYDMERKFNGALVLGKYGFDDKNENGEFEFLDFVLADTVEAMELKGRKLKEHFDRKLEKAVNERFKQNGRTIGGSGSSNEKPTAGNFGKSLAQSSTQNAEASQRATDYYFGK